LPVRPDHEVDALSEADLGVPIVPKALESDSRRSKARSVSHAFYKNNLEE